MPNFSFSDINLAFSDVLKPLFYAGPLALTWGIQFPTVSIKIPTEIQAKAMESPQLRL